MLFRSIEGWHRTIQHLQQYPEGYIGPAWVAYGATYTSDLKQGVAEGQGSLQSWVNQDQAERNEYAQFVKSKAGDDWNKGAKMYAQLKKRPSNDIFGDTERLNQFIETKFDFTKFTNDDWDNYWLLAQHCDHNRNFQKQALATIAKYQGTDHSHYKYLYDRISCGTTGQQKYGTQDVCVADKQGVAENFADGRDPQHKGDSARHGIPKHATIAQLEKIRSSKTASPRKKQLAHWQINMRRGRAKARR